MRVKVSVPWNRQSKFARALVFLATAAGEVSTQGDVFVMDSCPNVDGSMRSRAYSGYRVVKYEKRFGLQRHLLCTPADL